LRRGIGNHADVGRTEQAMRIPAPQCLDLEARAVSVVRAHLAGSWVSVASDHEGLVLPPPQRHAVDVHCVVGLGDLVANRWARPAHRNENPKGDSFKVTFDSCVLDGSAISGRSEFVTHGRQGGMVHEVSPEGRASSST
jgi:hypothetical protein